MPNHSYYYTLSGLEFKDKLSLWDISGDSLYVISMFRKVLTDFYPVFKNNFGFFQEALSFRLTNYERERKKQTTSLIP